MIIQVIGAFLGILCVSVIYGIERKFFKYCALCGSLGWMLYLWLHSVTDSTALRIYLSALAVALMSHIFARILKAPVTVFLIPGILPLVPGLDLYRAVYNLIMVSSEMAGFFLMKTLEAAGCIALAIFTMDTAFRMTNRRVYQIRWRKGSKPQRKEAVEEEVE